MILERSLVLFKVKFSSAFLFRLIIPFPFETCGTTSRILDDVMAGRSIEFTNSVWVDLGEFVLPFRLSNVVCIYNDTTVMEAAKHPM